MAVEVKIPEVGESITEGFLAEWSQSDGAVVAVEDPLLVLETDKITMTVNAEHAGRLKIMVAEGETVEVGQVVEGRVTAMNTGGLELSVNHIRAFMPISQIEMFRVGSD